MSSNWFRSSLFHCTLSVILGILLAYWAWPMIKFDPSNTHGPVLVLTLSFLWGGPTITGLLYLGHWAEQKLTDWLKN